MPTLVHDLVTEHSRIHPDRPALIVADTTFSYEDLANAAIRFSSKLIDAGIRRRSRVAIYAEKRFEVVVAILGTSQAGAVFVPINPMLKSEQVVHILRDCNVHTLVTTSNRLQSLRESLRQCPDLDNVFVIDSPSDSNDIHDDFTVIPWSAQEASNRDVCATESSRCIDADMAALLYTSGSTGKPKGVVLSHRNIVAGAISVAEYLNLTSDDRLLCVLPLSFDYGLNQITTAILSGATAILFDHLFPRDVIKAVAKYRITGLAAVPALWIQLAELQWPSSTNEHLRYITNSGGAMPRDTLARLRNALPSTKPFLMYGLTEAFRSTYLPPDEIDRRPDSIGKAIPNAEVIVVRSDGSPCLPGEHGELVHRGVHVALGYWNDTERTAERFKPAPGQPSELPVPELAVWSGDTARIDDDGFIYFIGRRDEMIKTSGFRVSPTEVEEALYSSNLIGEAAAFGVPHRQLGQAIAVVVTASKGAEVTAELLRLECQKRLPAYMIPHEIAIIEGPLPRNPNGKIDRRALAMEHSEAFSR